VEHRFSVAADHPALAGHFPGNPLVPGVVLLDEIAGALAQLRPGTKLIGLPGVKFVSPLRAGENCVVRFTPTPAGTVKFDCATTDRPIASGSFRLEEGG
jgi:3-hydroxymyristoyl/3-hydroxydecanoyl-(acyl carrier protein) dehydratase